MNPSARRPQTGPPPFFKFIWLIYLIFPLYYLFKQTAMELAAGLILLAVFVGLYLYSYGTRPYRLAAVLAMLAIVAVYSFWFDAGYLYLALFASPMIGLLPTKRQTLVCMSALIALFVIVIWRYKLIDHPDDLIQLLPPMLVMLFMPIGFILGKKSRELREKLALANEEIARLSKNEERQRISRDLHDTLGHTLSLITLKSELAEKLIAKNPERATQEVRDIQNTSRAALRQVRELVSGMNAVTIRDELVHAKQLLAAADMELKVQGDIQEGSVSPLADNILGMCLREAVTNTVKHSKARVCTVEWLEEPDRLKLTVSDDGIGADLSSSESSASGSGLRGMKERLKLVEGDVLLEAAKGRGTTVVFTVPKVAKSIGSEESKE